MAISWVARQKILYLSAFLLIVLTPIFYVAWKNWPRPSCTDNKQNQKEEGVDCGGPCIPCVSKPTSLITHWSRSFKIGESKTGEGLYDMAALVENPNADYVIKSLDYQFKVYDSDNILIGQTRGNTFVNQQEMFLMFNASMNMGFRIPAKTFLELEDGYENKWEFSKKEKPSISVISKKFTNEPFARFEVNIKNNSLKDVVDLIAGGVLLDKNNNAIAASITNLDILNGDGSDKLVFTWPKPLAEAPAFDEIYMRVNLTK